jgi:REP element-mobilizing transposase RayT
MPRVARVVIPKCPHHVTQRGNNRQDVFFVDDDRASYLGLLREEGEQYGLEVEGYCLMSNHIHLIVTPRSEAALAKALGRAHYAWSSAAAHCGQGWDRSGLLDLVAWGKSPAAGGWRQTLAELLPREAVSALRLSTHRGRPLGSDRFLSKIERLVGRRLRPLPVGRPRKKENNR